MALRFRGNDVTILTTVRYHQTFDFALDEDPGVVKFVQI